MKDEDKGSEAQDGRRYISTAADVVTGAAGAAVGLIDPVLGVIGAGAAPAVSHAMKDLGEIVAQRLRLRLWVVADACEKHAGESFDRLIERAKGDPAKEEVAERVFRIASQPGTEAKMRALGRALADGVLADSSRSVDEVSLMLRAIEDLEAPHILVLERLFREGDRYSGIPDCDLASMFPNGVRFMYSILKTLEQHGLAGPLGDHGEKSPDSVVTWAIWDFGVLLMEKLFDVGREDSEAVDANGSQP